MESLWLFQKTQWTNTSRWHCTPDNHRLWKLTTGLQATWAMSFSTLPPDSRTLISKWNTKLALIWKEDFGPLGNSPVLLLSPGKTPLTTTVAKWCLDALTPASVHSLWSSPKFLNRCRCLLDNCQISSLPPGLCILVNQTERPFWRLRKPLQVFWVD